ncbi:hypothetical protein OHR86_22560 [Streptomyces sp. NBC_00441]|uniref:hypothetical protein n=1 Tax=Streptomyces sp. NBC_00441 TaxID=2975742 RepID=UPI002E2890D8|nr:hypothetical protein [Streptomyces sp. NBC_00441]
MGYDMYTVQEADADEQAAVKAAGEKCSALVRPWTLTEGTPEREAAEKAQREAFAAYDAAQKSYFRLNIWGMSVCAQWMDRLGMLTGEAAPEWPELGAYGLDDWPDGDDNDLSDADRKYLAAQAAVLAHEPQPVTGIPAHKFGSNDGWLVTPAQCAAALAMWEKAPAEHRKAVETEREWWPSWIAFLAHSQERGGFRVH